MPLGVGLVVPGGRSLSDLSRARAEGAFVWDVDAIKRIDYHNGFGSMAVGHAHPKIVEAIDKAARSGTHFAVTTETTVLFAEELCRRYRLERVRLTNSGTEATMDAIRVARGATGRDLICKIEGSYHGHHDAVMFSVDPEHRRHQRGRRRRAAAGLEGHPGRPGRVDTAVPYNDLDGRRAAVRRPAGTSWPASSSSRS